MSELVLSEQQARMARPMPSQPQAANAATDPLQQSIATLEAQLSQKDQVRMFHHNIADYWFAIVWSQQRAMSAALAKVTC